MNSKSLVKELLNGVCLESGQRGSHTYFKHLHKLGKLTILHPRKDLPVATVKAIRKQPQLV
jgi:predicted RNA binding protein YcfA (HicA-like mRNA interferase family)